MRFQIWSLDGHPYRYSLPSCFGSCMQEAAKSGCGCLLGFPLVSRTRTDLSQIPFCFDLSADVETLINRTACMMRHLANTVQDCGASCNPPCTEVRFPGTTHVTRWPRKSQQLPFWRSHIRGTDLETRFSVYERIENLTLNGSLPEAQKLLSQTTLIEDNFLKASVYISTVDVAEIKDHKAISLVDLFGSIGGTLNLYSGISCIVVMEIIDLFYNICFSRKEETEEGEAEASSPRATQVRPFFLSDYGMDSSDPAKKE